MQNFYVVSLLITRELIKILVYYLLVFKQWAHEISRSKESQGDTFTFLIPFPNACFQVQITDICSSKGDRITIQACGGYSKTNFKIFNKYTINSYFYEDDFFYFALGK